MKVILLTGIYPPAIGGPATYVINLARELTALGHAVTVVTYSNERVENKGWHVITVPLGLPIFRWFAYARAIKNAAKDADVIEAFSSISCGIPLILSRVQKPKRVLRLGGDFLWERYTDRGGRKSLREWYESRGWSVAFGQWLMGKVLNKFDTIVFSTRFQEEIYEEHYKKLPPHVVIENALVEYTGAQSLPGALALEEGARERPHRPFRLLFLGRFVGFKNLFALLTSMLEMPDCVLTLVGEGPLDDRLRAHMERLGLQGKVQFVAPVAPKERLEIFAYHDLLILPSLTEISPHSALEAQAVGLPVLLTDEHGLTEELVHGADVAVLKTPRQIAIAVRDVRESYDRFLSIRPPAARPWKAVAKDHAALFESLKR